eukprot:scaffold280781_cov25-Prasinocladus_malaysianus.AAC.1
MRTFSRSQFNPFSAEERLGALTRTASRLEDALLPFLPSRHRAWVSPPPSDQHHLLDPSIAWSQDNEAPLIIKYVLGSGAATAARLLRALAPEIQEITHMGVEHICKVRSPIRHAMTKIILIAVSLSLGYSRPSQCDWQRLPLGRLDQSRMLDHPTQGCVCCVESVAAVPVLTALGGSVEQSGAQQASQ